MKLALRPGRALLVLALAALVALPTFALAGPASAGAAAAHAAKARRCRRRRGHARARSCRRAARRHASGGSVPRPFTPLTGPDNLNVLVFPAQVVQVRRGNVETNCTGGSGGSAYTKTFAFIATADLHGASFSGRKTFPQSNYVRVEGRFVSDRKATGTFAMGNIRMPDGAVCDSGPVSFTATR